MAEEDDLEAVKAIMEEIEMAKMCAKSSRKGVFEFKSLFGGRYEDYAEEAYEPGAAPRKTRPNTAFLNRLVTNSAVMNVRQEIKQDEKLERRSQQQREAYRPPHAKRKLQHDENDHHFYSSKRAKIGTEEKKERKRSDDWSPSLSPKREKKVFVPKTEDSDDETSYSRSEGKSKEDRKKEKSEKNKERKKEKDRHHKRKEKYEKAKDRRKKEKDRSESRILDLSE